MKDALKNMLTLMSQNNVFLCQVSADVSALRIFVSQLSPEVNAFLEKQMALERDKIQQQIENFQKEIVLLQIKISNLMN